MDQYLKWAADGYMVFRTVPGHGICAIMRFSFTVDICCQMKACGYYGRYQFDDLKDALDALITWNGTGDPGDRWICHVGGDGRFYNPKRSDYSPEFE